VDLRPGAIKRSYYSTQAKVVKYYSNLRGFYEFESLLHNVQRVTSPAESEPRQREKPKERRKENDKTSGRPNKGQGKNDGGSPDRNYAEDDTQPVLAKTGTAGNADGGLELGTEAAGREA
jgi:hypothetical protein